MRAIYLLPLAAIAAAAPAVPAVAAPDADAVSVRVSYADLDLADVGDAARLRSRLGRAATSACAEPGRQGVQARRAYMICRDAALGQARLAADRAIASAVGQGGGKVQTARR